MTESESLKIAEAATAYLEQLSAAAAHAARAEVGRFVRWYPGRDLDTLRPHEVEGYAGRFSSTDTDNARKMQQVRDFLAFVRKQGWTPANLATHLKLKKTPRRKTTVRARQTPKPMTLSDAGRVELEAELQALNVKRPLVVAEMARAAADKDFKENAPYHAAKEQLGYLHGRIEEIDEILKAASMATARRTGGSHVDIGSVVCVCDLGDGENCTYTVVDTREADARRGKISNDSPVGQALIGSTRGDVIEVYTPAGKMRYRITSVKN